MSLTSCQAALEQAKSVAQTVPSDFAAQLAEKDEEIASLEKKYNDLIMNNR